MLPSHGNVCAAIPEKTRKTLEVERPRQKYTYHGQGEHVNHRAGLPVDCSNHLTCSRPLPLNAGSGTLFGFWSTCSIAITIQAMHNHWIARQVFTITLPLMFSWSGGVSVFSGNMEYKRMSPCRARYDCCAARYVEVERQR